MSAHKTYTSLHIQQPQHRHIRLAKMRSCSLSYACLACLNASSIRRHVSYITLVASRSGPRSSRIFRLKWSRIWPSALVYIETISLASMVLMKHIGPRTSIELSPGNQWSSWEFPGTRLMAGAQSLACPMASRLHGFEPVKSCSWKWNQYHGYSIHCLRYTVADVLGQAY